LRSAEGRPVTFLGGAGAAPAGDPPAPVLDWRADALRWRLDPLLPGVAVEVVARAESTNGDLLERARSVAGRRRDDLRPTLRVAEHQIRGRGRQGRAWLSAPGASLTFSLALPLVPASWSGLSLAVGVALADALDPPSAGLPLAPTGAAAGAGPREAAAPRIGLKWPNDLWLWEGPGRGRKLGGILIETVPVGAQRLAVIGVGLNVRPLAAAGAPDAVTAAFSQGCASLSEIDPAATAPDVLARVAPALVRGVLAFSRDGRGPLCAAYACRDVRAGQTVVMAGVDGRPGPQGVAEGIDEHGALRLRTGQGPVDVVSGEVSVRLSAAGGGGAAC